MTRENETTKRRKIRQKNVDKHIKINNKDKLNKSKNKQFKFNNKIRFNKYNNSNNNNNNNNNSNNRPKSWLSTILDRARETKEEADVMVETMQAYLQETPGYIIPNKKTTNSYEGVLDKAIETSLGGEESINRTDNVKLSEKLKFLNINQREILEQSDIITATKRFELKLTELGPYTINYARSGRYLLLGGKRGHIASIDWMGKKISCELQVKETIRDVQFLHQETMFAVAQKRYLYIYDNEGIELHGLKSHYEVCKLDFLPYHFLLVSANKRGLLQYLDISLGKIVANIRTMLGPTCALTHNPSNAISHLGHSNGTITLWSPNTSKPLVKMLAHRGPVNSLIVDRTGNYMISSGVDCRIRLWDIRNYNPLGNIYTITPTSQLALSQRDILATACGKQVLTYKDPFQQSTYTPYIRHTCDDVITSIEYCPYEDVLGIGHNAGYSSILIPGSAEPNIDSLQPNPYQTKRQRRELEVKMLLEKIQPEFITLNADHISKIPELSENELEKMQEKEEIANIEAMKSGLIKKKKMKQLKELEKIQRREKLKEKSELKQKESLVKSLEKKKQILLKNYTVLQRFK